jgi:6-phospho-beta-glucosidase
MKIAIVGGASVRTPLLVRGLAASDLPIREIALFDTDRERLTAIARLARSYAPGVQAYDEAGACLADATFIVLSVRVGGIDARARDEATAIAHGVVGQETVGPGGFAMAMRNAPHAAAYARLAARVAPNAWVVNFTNPVGIVTEAMNATGHERVIGICDTPAELFEDAAHVLALDPGRCFFDYFGLNHLGWLREVFCGGEPQLPRLWNDPVGLGAVYRRPLFEAAFLQQLRLLPTEYLYFYYSAAAAFENVQRAGVTRGQAIAQLNAQLFRHLASSPADGQAIYEAYLAERNAGYMAVESGGRGTEKSSSSYFILRTSNLHEHRSFRPQLSGYDRIALAVIRAIHFDERAVIPLNVRNRGSIPLLADEDVVEVPCEVGRNGARPLAVGAVPESVRDLLQRVKDYERLTVRAAETADHEDAVHALASNPLIESRTLAASLVGALQPW